MSEVTSYENETLYCPGCKQTKISNKFRMGSFLNELTDELEYRYGNLCTDCREPIRMPNGHPKHIDPPTDGNEIIEGLSHGL